MSTTRTETVTEQDSVEIGRTAAGKYTFSVKCYAATSDEARERAAATITALRLQYPDHD